MRVVVQRASQASVSVGAEVVGRLPGPGLVALVGVTHDDTRGDAESLAGTVWRLRILHGERSASDLVAPLLVVSQFTLYAKTHRGRRPSWSAAAPRRVSEPLVAHFVATLRGLGAHVETGQFGAEMAVELINDGPMTVVLDSRS